MPSPSRSSSTRRKRSAATRIQKRVRGKQTRKKLSPKTETILERIKTNIELSRQCAICLDTMKHNEAITKLTCGHRFHSDCIQHSLRSNNPNCPICRAVIVNNPYAHLANPNIQPIRANRTFGNIPLSQQQQEPPPQSLILDPIQRRQYTLQRLQEIEAIEQSITEQRQQLPDPPTIPALTFNEALTNEILASETEQAIRRLYNEASINYNYYNRSNINDELLEQDVTNMFFITSQTLTYARNNTRNAARITEHLANSGLAN